VHGVIAADDSVRLKLAAQAPNGSSVEAVLLGRIGDGGITVSGRWTGGREIAGDWKRTP